MSRSNPGWQLQLLETEVLARQPVRAWRKKWGVRKAKKWKMEREILEAETTAERGNQWERAVNECFLYESMLRVWFCRS
jgi:hypothetical protein